MKSYFWDFFGPRAEGTGQQAVFCSPPPEFQVAIERSLRPRRSTEE
jgi:hypothetical protein